MGKKQNPLAVYEDTRETFLEAQMKYQGKILRKISQDQFIKDLLDHWSKKND